LQVTTNYGFKKPEGNDVVNIDDINYNTDAMDIQLKNLNDNVDRKISEVSLSLADKINNVSIIKNGKYTATQITNKFMIPEDIFSPTKDVLILNYNGIMLEKDINYSLNGSEVTLGFNLEMGEIIDYQINKSTTLPSETLVDGGLLQNDTVNSYKLTQDLRDKINKVTGLETSLADYVKHPAFAVTTGSANTYIATLNPVPTAYVDGMGITVKINVDSTGTATLNINSLGAKGLKTSTGNDVTNLKTGGIYTFRYNETTGNFILQGEGVDVSSLITSTNNILGM
jgi:hypothetical protein